MMNVNAYLNNEMVTVLTKQELKEVAKEIKRRKQEEVKEAKRIEKEEREAKRQQERYEKESIKLSKKLVKEAAKGQIAEIKVKAKQQKELAKNDELYRELLKETKKARNEVKKATKCFVSGVIEGIKEDKESTKQEKNFALFLAKETSKVVCARVDVMEMNELVDAASNIEAFVSNVSKFEL